MPTARRWQETWQGLGLEPPNGLYDELCLHYREAHRAYHTLQHLRECFGQFDGVRHLAVHPSEVELALWFHDAIYDPRQVIPKSRARLGPSDLSSLPVPRQSRASVCRSSSLRPSTRVQKVRPTARSSLILIWPSWALLALDLSSMKRKYGASMRGSRRRHFVKRAARSWSASSSGRAST